MSTLGSGAEGFPLLPPLPGGRAPQPAGVRSVARLVAGLRTAVVTVQTDEVVAMVVFVEHQPVDGIAVRGDRRVEGADALDEIADVAIQHVAVTEVTPELARVVGSYFLPTEVRAVPAGFVAPEDFVRSLARPGQRGCLLVRTDDALGTAFLAGGRVVLAYRQDGPIGGFEQVAPLFAVPGATLWARLGPDLTEPAVLSAPAADPAPPATVPVQPSPALTANGSAGPAAAPATPLDVALAEVRALLGVHALRVEPILRQAGPTTEGLRAAAESLRERRVRLLSPMTMDLVADRVLAALDAQAAAGRTP